MNMTKVADALRALADALEDGAPAQKDVPEKAKGAKGAKPEPKPEPKPEKVEAEPEADEVASTEDMIQALQKVAKVCGRSKIDEILAEFNVKKAGQVAEGDRADVILLANRAVEEAS